MFMNKLHVHTINCVYEKAIENMKTFASCGIFYLPYYISHCMYNRPVRSLKMYCLGKHNYSIIVIKQTLLLREVLAVTSRTEERCHWIARSQCLPRNRFVFLGRDTSLCMTPWGNLRSHAH